MKLSRERMKLWGIELFFALNIVLLIMALVEGNIFKAFNMSFILNILLFFLLFFGLGKKALYFLKLRIWGNKGTHFIKHHDGNLVDIDFDAYQKDMKWGESDNPIPAEVTRVYHHEKTTGCPVVFLKQGEPQNVNPFKSMTPRQAAAWSQQTKILSFNAGKLAKEAEMEKSEKFGNWLPVILSGLCLLGIIVLIIFVSQNSEILANFVAEAKTIFASYQPLLEQATANQGSMVVS